jgi:hypothetical protein
MQVLWKLSGDPSLEPGVSDREADRYFCEDLVFSFLTCAYQSPGTNRGIDLNFMTRGTGDDLPAVFSKTP